MEITHTDSPASTAREHSDTGLRARLDLAIERALQDHRVVGTVVLVARGGETVYRRAAGFADREAGRSMQENSIFLLASVAKPIVTAAALRLVENGRMNPGDSVRRWLPEFKPRLPDGRVPEIKIHHLLTHSASYSYSLSFLLTQPASPMYSWNHKTAHTIGCGFRADLIAPTRTLMRSSGGLPPRRSATSRAPDGVIQWR
jgi:CubicO group peptidase (beta-lactamase class C family)